ncbi:hypothetical protein DYB26_005626, partial [Aphanomyces astaci]
MLNPESGFKIKWDLGLALCVFYTSCVVPVRISFSLDATGFFYFFECGIDFCFFLDILLSFRTGLVDPTTGHVYYNKRQIIRSYLRGWFGIDLVSTLPLEFIAKHLYPEATASSSSNTLQSAKILRGLKLIRLLKLVRIRKIGQMISKLEEETTVGYGDITPKTKTELIIAMFVMIIGVSMFGYVIGNITSLVDNINASGRMQSQHITTLKEYVIVRNLPKHTALWNYLLGKRVLDHFEYLYRHRSVFDEGAILTNLPTGMRNDVVHHVLHKMISRIHFLSTCHHEGLVADLAVAMQPFFCVQDEAVYVQQDMAAHVFFILK